MDHKEHRDHMTRLSRYRTAAEFFQMYKKNYGQSDEVANMSARWAEEALYEKYLRGK